jgi:hypothetical protein
VRQPPGAAAGCSRQPPGCSSQLELQPSGATAQQDVPGSSSPPPPARAVRCGELGGLSSSPSPGGASGYVVSSSGGLEAITSSGSAAARSGAAASQQAPTAAAAPPALRAAAASAATAAAAAAAPLAEGTPTGSPRAPSPGPGSAPDGSVTLAAEAAEAAGSRQHALDESGRQQGMFLTVRPVDGLDDEASPTLRLMDLIRRGSSVAPDSLQYALASGSCMRPAPAAPLPPARSARLSSADIRLRLAAQVGSSVVSSRAGSAPAAAAAGVGHAGGWQQHSHSMLAALHRPPSQPAPAQVEGCSTASSELERLLSSAAPESSPLRAASSAYPGAHLQAAPVARLLAGTTSAHHGSAAHHATTSPASHDHHHHDGVPGAEELGGGGRAVEALLRSRYRRHGAAPSRSEAAVALAAAAEPQELTASLELQSLLQATGRLDGAGPAMAAVAPLAVII